MHRYRILFLIISASTAFTLASCGTVRTVDGFAKTEAKNGTYTATYFSDAATDYVYKMNIAVYGHEFGGILIIKKTGDVTHRVAFTTDFGNKLFDLEFTGNDFKVNYIIEELDRKMIVNTLRDDFKLLLKKDHTIEEEYQNDEFTVYKTKDDRRFNYLFLDKDANLRKMVHATKRKEKVIFTYVPAGRTLAQNIIIDHKNIKLKIELNYIDQ
jgi:hypothetical protein